MNDQGESLADQANALGNHFENISSSAHYSESFLKRKAIAEKKPFNRKGGDDEPYNRPFTLAEFKAALSSCSNSSPRVVYDMIRYLNAESQMALLSLFNRIWAAGYIPSTWKEAIVIPTLKTGKDPSSASSYRPIALTSCICKLF